MSDPLMSAYTHSAAQTPSNASAANVQSPPGPAMVTLQPASSGAAGGAAAPAPVSAGGMVQLLPSHGGGPSASPAAIHASHARSQSTFVPMHSPQPGGGGSAGGIDLSMLGLNMGGGSRLHGSMGHTQSAAPASSAALATAGILATTPSASALTNLTSPVAAAPVPDNTYSYPANSDGYDVYAEIGSGAFSTVYRASVRETGEEVAIKVIDLDLFNTNWDEIRREILIMSQLQHPNVVRLKTAFVDGQDLWIVLSLMTAGSCASVMKELGATGGIKDEVAIATILKEVLQALAYFHKHGSIHRDVKAGNILLSGEGEVQLADFGVAGTLMEGGDRKKNRQTFTGTPCWMAPEVMEHTEGYDEKADVWSVGITALELGYGRAPYAKFPPMKVMLLTLQEDPPTAAIYKDNSGYEFSKAFHSMISKCLRRDPKKRPTVRKLLEHKFFARAANKTYLYEQIISKLPPRQANGEKMSIRKHNRGGAGAGAVAGGADGVAAGAGEATLRNGDLASNAAGGGGGALHASDATEGGGGGGNSSHAGAGVKLGSWIFDEEDINAFTKQEGLHSLDLLTGTLQHQVPQQQATLLQQQQQAAAAPHHGHHPSAVPEADEYEDVDEPYDEQEELEHQRRQQQQQQLLQQQQQQQLQQQQQQQTRPSKQTSPSHPSNNPSQLLSASAAFAAAAAPSSASAAKQEEPHDFFADVSAPAEQAALGPLSPSAAFAAVASGQQSLPAVLSSAAGTPTLSSVQGRTRQFMVSEEELPHPAPAAAAAPVTASSRTPVTVKQQQPTLDLLSDNISLDVLAGSAGFTDAGPPSASQQYLNSMGGGAAANAGTPKLDADLGFAPVAERAATPLSLDSLAPGSATLAYLAAMGGGAVDTPSSSTAAAAPASTAMSSPATISAAERRGADRPLSEGRSRMSSMANESLLPVSRPQPLQQGATPAGSPMPSTGARQSASGIGRSSSPLPPAGRNSGGGTAPGLQLLDMAGPAGSPMSTPGSGGSVPSAKAMSTKRGSGTLASLGLGLLPVSMPVIRPTPTASSAATAAQQQQQAAGATSPGHRPQGSPASTLHSGDHLGSSLFAPHTLQLHSPQAQQAQGSDAAGSSSSSHLTLNIPSPPGSIQQPQQAGVGAGAGAADEHEKVGRFQVSTSGE